MRILCIGTDHPPHRRGGYELQCAGFAAHARQAGHDVRVLCAGPGPSAGGVHRELVRFPVVPEPIAMGEARRAECHNAGVLAYHLRTFRPDVVSWWRLGELSMSLLERSPVPAVGMVCDGWMLDGPARDPWARLTGRAPALGRSRWLFVSRHLRSRLTAAGVPHGPVVHAGIEPVPAAPPPPAWSGRLLYAGRLSPLKGVDVAIRAVARLAGMRLEIVGEGPPAYERQLRALAGERVSFLGPLSRERLAERYAAADAVLFPVRWDEPFGLVPLEAMAVGRPVVATGRGGSAEYLRDGENALLAAPGDAASTAAAIGRLAHAPRLREALVAAGRRTAALFPAARSHAAVLQALEVACASRS